MSDGDDLPPQQLDGRTLAASRVWAAHKFPYLASALFATDVIAQPGIGGAAVDERWRLYVDPAVAAGWSVEQMGALIVHHVGHLLREHAERARSLGISEETAEKWTKACDAELNDDLADAGITPPGHVVLPEHLGGPRGRMAEEYFALQPVTSTPDDDDDDETHDHGSGTDGRPREWDREGEEQGGGLTEHEAQLVRRRTAESIREAARERSDVPGGWQRWAGDLLEPKVDWRRALAAEIRRSIQRHAGRVDYSYRRPSRRATVSPDIVLPAMEHPVPEIAIVVDTSGSMRDDQLQQVLSEIDALLAAIGIRSSGVNVLSVDTEVHARSRVHAARHVELAGGGGTNMARGIEAAAALRPKPAVVVVLTDGYTPWPAQAPKAMSVVVALVQTPHKSWPVPEWARTVIIDDAVG